MHVNLISTVSFWSEAIHRPWCKEVRWYRTENRLLHQESVQKTIYLL